MVVYGGLEVSGLISVYYMDQMFASSLFLPKPIGVTIARRLEFKLFTKYFVLPPICGRGYMENIATINKSIRRCKTKRYAYIYMKNADALNNPRLTLILDWNRSYRVNLCLPNGVVGGYIYIYGGHRTRKLTHVLWSATSTDTTLLSCVKKTVRKRFPLTCLTENASISTTILDSCRIIRLCDRRPWWKGACVEKAERRRTLRREHSRLDCNLRYSQ